jgi:hypothetical protein
MATRPSMFPETLLPRISVTRWRREGIPAIAARLAAALRVPAIMGRRETADIVVVVVCVLCVVYGKEMPVRRNEYQGRIMIDMVDDCDSVAKKDGSLAWWFIDEGSRRRLRSQTISRPRLGTLMLRSVTCRASFMW